MVRSMNDFSRSVGNGVFSRARLMPLAYGPKIFCRRMRPHPCCDSHGPAPGASIAGREMRRSNVSFSRRGWADASQRPSSQLAGVCCACVAGTAGGAWRAWAGGLFGDRSDDRVAPSAVNHEITIILDIEKRLPCVILGRGQVRRRARGGALVPTNPQNGLL